MSLFHCIVKPTWIVIFLETFDKFANLILVPKEGEDAKGRGEEAEGRLGGGGGGGKGN